MQIQQLYYYMELCRQKNFTEAGYVCNMTQGALSKQIKKLENELGVTLIRRNTRKFELTKEGEEFYRYAQEITDLYEEMLRQIRKKGKSASAACRCWLLITSPGSWQTFMKNIRTFS